MNNQSYEITVDTQKSINHSNIEFSQNNLNISELIFNITEDGKELPLKDTDEIIVYFKKPDKTVVFQDKEIELLDKSKGKVKVLLTTQTLVKAGDVEGEISIGRVDNGMKKRTSTYGFSFKVRSSLASNDSIESTNEFQMFDQLLELGKQDIPAIIDSKKTAEQALKKSEENANQIGILSENITDIKKTADEALPKTGGTMTGPLALTGGSAQLRIDEWAQSVRVDQPTVDASARGFDFYENNVRKGGFGRYRGNGIDQMYIGWGEGPWEPDTSLSVSSSKLTYKNKPVAMRDKDGRANLVLTADAANFNDDRLLVADRRGNTVTLRGTVSLKAGATGNIVATLPADMRPTFGISQTVLTTEGTPVSIDVTAAGDIIFWVKGKDIHLLLSYVVD
ncbi:hypothetical protein bcgnr5371_57970 [Bacillus cereus]